MEVILQWLDELDDLFYSGVLLWERLRAGCLWLGLLASLGVHAAARWDLPIGQLVLLLNVSVFSVIAWSTITLAGRALDQRASRPRKTA